jgi:hypothetical protein
VIFVADRLRVFVAYVTSPGALPRGFGRISIHDVPNPVPEHREADGEERAAEPR